jgi:hypothetical protein
MVDSLWIVASAFLANVIVNILVLRFWKSLSVVKSLFISTSIGFLLLLVLSALQLQGAPVDEIRDLCGYGLANLVIFLGLAYLFFNWVHIPVASVRLRVLHEIELNPGLNRAEILNQYNAKKIIEIRLERLLSSGQIVAREGRYFTGRKRILYIALFFYWFKRLAGIKRDAGSISE